MLRRAVFVCDGCGLEVPAPQGGGMPEGWERGVFGLEHACLHCRQYIKKASDEAIALAVVRLHARPSRRAS